MKQQMKQQQKIEKSRHQITETLEIVLRCIVKISIPAFLFFLFVWQSVDHANLNRQLRKLSQKKEELYKKNYDLKVGIASFSSTERIETLYRKNSGATLSNTKKIVTLILPPENKKF